MLDSTEITINNEVKIIYYENSKKIITYRKLRIDNEGYYCIFRGERLEA